jgi:hypothetical protein
MVISALGAPGPALAQSGDTNPFAPGLPQSIPSIPTQQTTPILPVQPTTTSAGGGLSGGAAVGIAIGAVIVLGGISFFIWYDARKRAPVRQRLAAEGVGSGGSKARPKPRKLSPAERKRRKRGRAR